MAKDALAAANQAIHDTLEDQLLSFYEALTALDMDDARARWTRWKALFRAHLALEEAELMPPLTALVAVHLPDNHTLHKQVDGDHTILERTINRIDEALAALADHPGERRALVRELDTFLLLRRVLEHHTLRETQHAYPLLDAHLDDESHAALLEGLRAWPPG